MKTLFWRIMECQPFVWGCRILAGYMVVLTWLVVLGSQL